MFRSQALHPKIAAPGASTQPSPHIVVGVTHSQTCLTLTGRLRALREAGFRVTLVASPGELLDRLAAAEGIEVAALPIQRGIAPFSDLVSLIRLFFLLRRLAPDMVEFSTPKAGFLGTVAARLCGVPVRIYMLRGLKLEGSVGIKRRLLLMVERMAAAMAHVVLCNSESLRSEALSLKMTAPQKLRVLGDGSSNGVHVERFSPGLSDVGKQLGIPADAPVVGFVGRLTKDKGIPELIQAFELMLRAEPECRLLLVGWYDAAEDALDISTRSRIANHPRILCTGFVVDPAPYYRAMDLFILPTWREGFPNVVLEAAATGIPAITTMCTGSRDSVIPEVTGILIPPGYPEAICEAVLKLLRDPERRRRMGRAARAWVLKHYAHDHVLGLVTAYYISLVEPAMDKDRLRRLRDLAAESR